MPSDSRRLQRVCRWAAGISLIAAAAQAVDGVIEISHACATSASGCVATGGDSGGYPVTIGQPGSYRLTSNLTVPVNTGGLEITASGGTVAIDLNGFAIKGPTTCTGSPCPVTGCSGGGSEKGVYSASGTALVSIRNGTIQGMGGGGIDLVAGGALEGVGVSHSGVRGVEITGGGAIVTKGGFFFNAGDGLFVDGAFSSTVSDVKTACNQDDGVEIGIASNVTGSTAEVNGGDGFQVGQGSSVTINSSRANLGLGLNEGPGSGYLGNVLTCNNAGTSCSNIAQTSGLGLQLGLNVCGTDTTCP